MQDFRPIFLTIYYKGTKALMNAHIDRYNQQLAQEWTENAAAFEKKYGGTYKKLRVKPNEEHTFQGILDCYGEWLKKNRRLKLLGGRDATFRTNNVWLSTHTRRSQTTIWRHINKGIQCGIFTNKVWHGTNSTFELEFNPAVLEAEYNHEFCSLLVENAVNMLGEERITDQIHSRLISEKPRFLDFPSGRMLSGCNHICSQILIQEHNGNMLSGVGVEKNADDFSVNKPEHGSTGSGEICAPEANAAPLDEKSSAARQILSTESKEALTGDEIALLRQTIQSAWCIAYTALFQNKHVSENDQRIIYDHLMKWFVGFKRTSMSVRLETFFERILLAKKYQMRNPHYTFMNPVTYFDPDTSKGFSGTKEWSRKQQEKRVKTSEYNENNKQLAKWYQKFLDDPSILVYQQATQALSKKRKKDEENFWLDMFNALIANSEKLTPQIFQRYYEQIMLADTDF